MGNENPSFNDILTASFNNHREGFVNCIMNNNAFFMMLDKYGMTRELDGGVAIVEPLMFNTSTAVGSYSGSDILDVSVQNALTAAKFVWKQIHCPISIDGITEFQNAGKSRRIELIQAYMTQAETSLNVYTNKVLFGDGSGNGGKDITGLLAAVEEGTVWSTYGDIDSNLFPVWRNAWATVGSFATNGIDKMKSMYNTVSQGPKNPNLIITTQAIYEYYEKTVSNVYRTMDLKTANIGFTNLVFKNCPIIFDDDCTSGYMYFIMSEFFKMVYGKGKKMTLTPFQTPHNQDIRVASMFAYLQLVCNHRRRQGVLTGITA